MGRGLFSAMFFSAAFICAMEDSQNVAVAMDSTLAALPIKKKKARPLKKICCDILIQKAPEIAKSFFKQDGLEELKCKLACRAGRVGSHEFVLSIIESVPITTTPKMTLVFVTRENKHITKEELQEILKKLSSYSKKDFASHKIIKEMKIIYNAYDALHIPPNKMDLFCIALGFNSNSCTLNRFLFKESYLKDYFIEQTINIPHDEEYFSDLAKKYKNDVLSERYSSQLARFANMAQSSIETELSKQKVAYVYSVGLMYRRLLTQLHKLLYLGFVTLPEYAFTSKIFSGIDAANDAIFECKMHDTCIDHVIYNLEKCFNKKYTSLKRARFKLLWDCEGHSDENREHIRHIMSFYRHCSKDVDYIIPQRNIRERYDRDSVLVNTLFNYHRSFYINALKLLLPVCKEEFECKKAQCAKALNVPECELEEYICHNPFYDVTIQDRWKALENKKDERI